MVSLNQTRGGFFYTETAKEATQSDATRDPDTVLPLEKSPDSRSRGPTGVSLLDGSLGSSIVIRTSARDHFKYIITGYMSMFELLVLFLYTLACFIDIYVVKDDEFIEDVLKNKFSFYSLLHVFLWIFVFIIDRATQYLHHKIRLRGYLKLYLQLRNVRRVPIIVYSSGMAAIVLVFSVERQLTYFITFSAFKFDFFITIIVGIELVVSGVGLVYYIWLTLRFNHSKPKPDTIGTEGHMVSPFLSAPPDIGFSRNDETENVEELLDKQADMIRYLRAHSANLGRKINELQDRLGPATDN